MNAQQTAVTLWKGIERAGVRPTLKSIAEIMRYNKLAFTDAELVRWLSAFRAIPSRSGAEAKRGLSPADARRRSQNRSKEGADAKEIVADASRARGMVSLVSSVTDANASVQESLLPDVARDIDPVTTTKAGKPRDPYVPPPLPNGLPEYFPGAGDALKRLAIVFCKAFGGCKSDDTIRKYGPGYAETLLICNARGFPVGAVWRAFGEVLVVRGGKPLFGAESKKVLSIVQRAVAGELSLAPRTFEESSEAEDLLNRR